MDSERDSAQVALCDEEKYKDYSDIDSDSHSFIQNPTRSRLFRPAIVVLSLIIILTPIVYLIAAHRQSTSPHLKFDQCGTTAEEARSRGCVFETTGFTWLPQECHDATTEEEFLNFIAERKIELYRDQNATQIVPIEEVRGGNGPGFWVRQQYHVTHCLFLLKKLHRGYAAGKILDGQIMPTHHTEHCIGQTLEGPEFRKDEMQFSYTKFPYCGKPGGYNVAWQRGMGPLGWTHT